MLQVKVNVFLHTAYLVWADDTVTVVPAAVPLVAPLYVPQPANVQPLYVQLFVAKATSQLVS